MIRALIILTATVVAALTAYLALEAAHKSAWASSMARGLPISPGRPVPPGLDRRAATRLALRYLRAACCWLALLATDAAALGFILGRAGL